jgi:redox-sensing transcriptional repressor
MHSHRSIGRLSLYRRLLYDLAKNGAEHVHSHQLAGLAEVTAAQVRRDLMAVGCPGTPRRGYNVRDLIESIGELLDSPRAQGAALVGIGNLGRALLAYFAGRRPKLAIVAAFDVNPAKVNRLVHRCRCYPAEKLPGVVRRKDIRVGIVAVPADEAQRTAEMLVSAGVRGIVNFAPVRLHVPRDVFVEDMDMTMSLEKVAYFARLDRKHNGVKPPQR